MRAGSRALALAATAFGVAAATPASRLAVPGTAAPLPGAGASVRQPAQQAPSPSPSPARVVIDLSDLSRPQELERRIRSAVPRPGPDLRVEVPNGRARFGDFSVGSSETVDGHLLVLNGDAQVYGRLVGNLVTVDGDAVIHPGGAVTGDVLALHGEVKNRGGDIGGEVRTLSAPLLPVPGAAPAAGSVPARIGRALAGLVGVFLTLFALGAGLVLFARHNLEIVADTAANSFGRSFITGLIGQILVLPTFGMLVVGLILSVAGILLLPFAVVVYLLLAILAVVGGYLGVAHAIGETYVRRRMAAGAAIGSPNSYRYLLVGLTGLSALWAAWALFGWVPVAGDLIRAAAVLVTWLAGTVGFGAALLSRAGAREHFAGRLIPPEALTDEYLWATPQFGVPAARRPPAHPGDRER